VDFFTVPTIRFQVLYVFLVLAHDRRRIVHVNVTAHPTAERTAQQLRDAFPWNTVPRFLLRDRDRIFGTTFRGCTSHGHHRGVIGTALALATGVRRAADRIDSPRVSGSRDRHQSRPSSPHPSLVHPDYHRSWTHLGLDKDAPDGRPVCPPFRRIVVTPEVGGLHHRYERRAA